MRLWNHTHSFSINFPHSTVPQWSRKSWVKRLKTFEGMLIHWDDPKTWRLNMDSGWCDDFDDASEFDGQ